MIRASDVRVPMRDGATLAADVFLPDDRAPRPAILARTPYSRATARAGHDPVALARAGWAVVVQDVRGRFDSHGTFDPFHQEGPDGADTIAWIADQPWCDGRVAMVGASYLGLSQWQAALEQPPALKAVAPMVVGGEVRDSWMYEGGALQLGFAVPYALLLALSGEPDDAAQEQLLDVGRDIGAAVRIPLASHPLRVLFPPFERWIDASDDGYWSPLDFASRARKVEVPAFQVAGWYDIFCESNLAHHVALRDGAGTSAARDGQRLIVGPWVHAGLFAPSTAEFDFGLEASGLLEGLPGSQLDWLQQAVDGEEVDGGVSVFVMGSGRWVDLDAWPPPARPLRLYLSSQAGANSLHGDGTLLTAPPPAGRDRFRYDPDDPVPTHGGRTLGRAVPLAGPADQRVVEQRPDVLVYTSEPLDHDVTVIGQVVATVMFASDGASADVTVKLVDVWPDGRALNVVDSVRRVPLEPGVAVPVEVTVGSTAQCFRAGHRIRVEVSSSNFPRLDRNPSTGEPAAEATRFEAAWQTVHHGGDLPSHVTLPVVE